MMIIDTHVHLDHADYNDDLNAVIARARASNVGAFIIPGADPRNLSRAKAIAYAYDNVFFAVGAHPHDIDRFDEAAMSPFLDDPKCVAIGECGLDYFRLPKNPDEAAEIKDGQKTVFKRHIAIANERKLPLIVHVRDAASDSVEALLAAETGGILHCFTGDERLLGLMDRGFYFGIGGALTFANAEKLREAAAKIPIERVALETDAPYLAPAPHRGKRNESGFLPLVAAKLAEIKNAPIDAIIDATTRSAIECFALKPLLARITNA
ncbi:MAG: TatD family hydrolase [Helicobacteraceae bacterium]|jgi:TatD DNase family protein|nr:TatD family hydrolase [Helicobacteraceae bacterium]